jgi:hypothetical protein
VARAALQTALLNIDANRALIDDASLRDELASAALAFEGQLARADAIVDGVRRGNAG